MHHSLRKFSVIFNMSLLLAAGIAGVSGVVYAANDELPVAAFASLPDVSNVVLSPDGKKLASIVRVNVDEHKGSVVHIIDLKTGTASIHAGTDNSKYIIKWVRWANNETVLISARFPMNRFGNPTTETRMLKLDVPSGKVKPAISTNYFEKRGWFPQFQDNIIDILPDEKDHILVSLRLGNEVQTQVMKLNLKRGYPKKFQRNKDYVLDWVTDRQHRVRVAKYYKDNVRKILVKDLESGKWQTLWEYEPLSESVVYPMGFDADPNILYFNAYHEGKLAVFKTNLTDSERTRELVYSDPNYDADGSLIYSRKNRRVVGLVHGGSKTFTYWDLEYQSMQQSIDKALPDTKNRIYNVNDDETRLIILSTSDTEAGTFRLWDRTKGTLQTMAYRYQALDPAKMVEKQRVTYAARDGLEIEAYLTRPAEESAGLVPAIIFPHGGPISHDGKGFDYWTQFFANRGYAVLQMNFRGSSGYGYDFKQSGLQNWGLQMQNDVEDGTRWLIDEEIADPDRICVVGASYGGYAALMEAARDSELYQCAVSFAGVTDLPLLLRSRRRYINYKTVKEQIGSNTKSLAERSPVNSAENIEMPVLLAHGTKDRSVGVKHSTRMHKKLKKLGKDVIYLEMKDGDHFLSNEKHRLEFFTQMDAFLKKHLN